MGIKETNNAAYKLTLAPLVLMIFSAVYGFTNAPRSFYLFGYNAIFWYILSAICFFLPYAIVCIEFGSAYKNESGGIYSWVSSSMGIPFGFVTVFIYYASLVIWMVLIVTTIWIPLSRIFEVIFFTGAADGFFNFFLGKSSLLGISGIALMLIVTFAITRGLRSVGRIASIGGLSTLAMNFVLIAGAFFVLIMTGHLEEPISWHAIATPRNPQTSFVTLLGYVTFALFAYSGLESPSGLVDKTHNPHRTFPLALIISAIVITAGYALMIFCVGIFASWGKDLNLEKVNLGNIPYYLMGLLGQRLAEAMHASAASAQMWNRIFQGVMALGVVVSLVGAFVIESYSPLKQLIKGTPSGLWPKAIQKERHGMPYWALWAQAAIVIVLIALNSFGGSTGKALFNQLTKLSNVALTVPGIFVMIAYIRFRVDPSIEKPFLVFKSKTIEVAGACVGIALLTFANIFAILDPGITGHKWGSVALYAAGPLFFALIAISLYYARKKHI